jgi:flagellar biogenesis protein FliO
MPVANTSNISTIQILRSYSNTTPTTLDDGQLAYSFVSNTLFIGSNTGVRIIGDPSTAVKAQAAYDQANVTIGVDATQNTRLTVIENTNSSQNVRLDYSNTAITIIQGVDVGQNARMTISDGVNSSQNSRLDYSNTAITIIQGVDSGQNARMTIIEGTDTSQNARMVIIEGTDTSQNARMTVSDGVNASQNVRLDYSNTAITIIQGVDVGQNARMVIIEGTDTSQNARMVIIEGVDSGQNSRMTISDGVNSSQNVRLDYSNTAITIIQGVDVTQNANISYAWAQANLANSIANTALQNTTSIFTAGNLTVANNLIVANSITTSGSGGNISGVNIVYANTFNAAVSYIFADGTIQTTAGSSVANTIYLQGALNAANANIAIIQGTDIGQNARMTIIEGTDVGQNSRMTIIEGVDSGQNSRMTISDGVNSSQNVRLDYSNTAITIIQGTDVSQNARMTIIEGTNTSQNARMAIIESVDASQNVRLDYSNSLITIIQGTDSSQNARMTIIEGVDVGQNTSIASTDGKMQSAYNQANTGTVLAQASYNFANNISSSLSGNSIVLGSNTTGLLVSNAVTLTTGTYITNGLAQINQVLGKLVPASPPNFPGAYRAITINSLVGPYRMTNFTQQDNSANSRTVAGGTSTTVLRSSSYTTSTIINVGPGDSGTVTAYKNNVSSGARTMVAGNGNAGTYNDLVILNNVDYGTITGAAQGFWSSMNVRASGAVANGWNEVYIGHSGTGDRTNVAFWYYDNSAPGTPTFASASIVPLSTSLTYSSTVPHYNSSTTFRLGVDVSKLSGDMYPASDTFFTGTAGGAFGTPTSNTYTAVGITTPLIRNLYVSSGSVTVNTTSTIIAGFGSSSTGPSVTVDNSYTTGSQAFTTALGSTVLYKTGTASAMEETSVTFGTTVGTGSGLAARIINPGTTDTPTYTASASLFDSQTGTLTANDATIVAATLKHDTTNYSTGYLPAGPNLSTGRTGSQYFTFRFVRTSVSKFDIKYTGTIAGLWVALPGSVIDTTSSINGWMDMSTAYAGSGHPGVNVGGNGSNGCALGGNAVLNSLVTNGSYTCTFGDVSSSSTATNEIYVRIKLTSSQTVSALTLQTASH